MNQGPGAKDRRLSPLRGRPVLQNKQMLARSDQSKLAPGEVLDRGRIALEALGFLAQQGVLRACALNGLLERLELLTLLHRLEKPLLSNQRIDEHDAANQQQAVFDCSSATTA